MRMHQMREVEAMTELKPIAAIEQLTVHQQQLDMDGVFVGVSRQALDELLAYVTRADTDGPMPGLRRGGSGTPG